MNRLEIAVQLLQKENIHEEKSDIASTCHAALEYADILLAIDAQTAKSAEQPANGSVAGEKGSTNNRSEEIAFLNYLLDNIPCLVPGQESKFFHKHINDRVAQLRAMQ